MPSQFNAIAHARAATGVMRHTPGKRFGRGLLAAAALATTISAAGPARADYGGAWVIELDQVVIKVANDGERYTSVVNSSPAITGVMSMELDAETSGVVKYWSLWNSIEAENMERKQFPELNYSKTYAINERYKVVRRRLPFSIPRQAYKSYAEEACNKLAKDLLLLHSKTKAEIFAEDRSIDVKVRAEIIWEMSGTASDPERGEVTGEAPPNPKIKPVTILCLKTPPAPPAVTAAAIVVQGIDPANSQGQCRMRLNGNLSSNVPNLDVSFRYVDDKGNRSDLKTVNTGDDRSVNFEHSYPLSPGQKSTKIRVVGESPYFTSNWKDFDYECEEGSVSEFVPLLPPKATALSFEVENEVFHKGKVCPSVIEVTGVIKGRGKSAGTITLVAEGNQIAEKPFDVIGDELKTFTAKYQVSWLGKPATQQDIPLGMLVYGLKPTDNEGNENNEIGNEAAAEAPSVAPLLDNLQKMVSVDCVDDGAEYASNDPTPPMLTFNPLPAGQTLYEGYTCPAEIALDARLLGRDPFEGRAVLIARQQQSLFEAQSQVKEFNFSVVQDEELTLPFQPEVRWSNVKQNGDAPPKQTIDLTFQVVSNGVVVNSVEQPLEIKCWAENTFSSGAASSGTAKISDLFAVPSADEVIYQGVEGIVCPARFEVFGSFEVQGLATGRAVLEVNGVVETEMPYSIQGGQTKAIKAEHDPSWSIGMAGPWATVDLALRLYDTEGNEVDRLMITEGFFTACRSMLWPSLTLNPRPVSATQYEGHACPAEIELDAQLLGRDIFEGRAVLIVRQQQSLFEAQSQVKEYNFSVVKDEELAFPFRPEVRWSNVKQNGDAPPKQTMDLTFQVFRSGGTVVEEIEQSLEVRCKGVTVPNLAISYDPPKATGLAAVAKADEVFAQGHICPAAISIGGVFKGQGSASGTAVLTANGVVKAEVPYSIEKDQTKSIAGEHDLNWSNPQGLVQNNVSLALRLYNAEGDEVDILTKTQTFECRKPELTRDDADRVGGLSSGGAKPTHAQGKAVAGQFALQTGPAFAILAPKGRVRAGRIELSGGPADAKYDLRFYRGDKGGYRAVRSAELPRQMTGRTASFNLRALSGSRTWRIEVCPAGSKSKAACKTSDFQLPRLKGAGGVKAPANPATTKVFVMPGIGN